MPTSPRASRSCSAAWPLRRAGRVALLTFGARRAAPAAAARRRRPALVALRRALGEGVARRRPRTTRDALADALRRVGRVARAAGPRRRRLRLPRAGTTGRAPLGALRARHAVLAVEVRDPREATLPAVGRLALVDPETGERVEVDTSRRRVRERFAAARGRAPREVAAELRRLRVDHVVAQRPTSDWLRELGRRLR